MTIIYVKNVKKKQNIILITFLLKYIKMIQTHKLIMIH